jgi:hypothetical protein
MVLGQNANSLQSYLFSICFFALLIYLITLNPHFFLWHCALEASLSHSSGSITVAGIILTLEHTRKTVALRQKFFFLAVVRQKHDGWGVCK